MTIDQGARKRAQKAKKLAQSINNTGTTSILNSGGGLLKDVIAVSPNIPKDSSTLTGLGTDGATSLNNVTSGGFVSIVVPGYYDPTNPNTGATLLSNKITIPSKQKFLGQGAKTKFVIDVNDPYPKGYLLFGTTTGYQSAQSYDLFGDKVIGNFYLDGRAAAGNNKTPTGIVVGQPTATVRDVYAYGIQTTVRGADVGGTNVDGHGDHLVISNVHTNYQPSPVDFDWMNPSNSKYAIDYLCTNIGADGALIERCQINPTGSIPTQKRGRHIGIRSFTCGVVSRILNGDIYFYQSKATLADSYFEHGQTTILDSEAHIERCMFWQRNEISRGSEIGCIPLRLIAAAGAESPSSNPVTLTLKDSVWNYDAVGQNTGYPALGGYTLTNPNFYIDPTLYTYVSIDNCWRGAPYTNGRGNYQRLGITCGQSEFDNYSHFASTRSRYNASTVSGGNRWFIEAKHGPISINASSTANVLEGTFIDTGHKTLWQLGANTYYYKANIYHDKIRSIGISGALEVSATTTVNGGVVNIRLGYDIPGGGYIIRIFRGTASGIYDSYVDIPVINAGRLCDVGNDVSSFPWISRTPGDVDPVNVGLSGGIDLSPGERTSLSDAYGKCIAFSITGAVPTVGGWRRGDEVRLLTPPLASARRLVGYRRLTNCLSTATTNVIGVDWENIYSSVPAPDGIFGANGSSVTVQAGVKRVNVSTTTANVVVTNVSDNEVEGYSYDLDVRITATGNTVKIAKSTGAQVITIGLPGLYRVAFRSDLATWVAVRYASSPVSGVIDEGSSAGLEQYVTTGTTTVTTDYFCKLLNVSSATTTVAITMPASIELGGNTVRLLVRAYTNTITVAKSTGAISTSGVITQTGLYELVFTQGTWLATRLGNIPA